MASNTHHIVILLAVVTIATALPEYPDRLPNGHRVPHPCFDNVVWKGVGHKFQSGGGTLNKFGQDFRDNNYEWNPCLCEIDSDGDGLTNGEELGDPYCIWTQGEIPQNIEGLGHPGVCEPMNSTYCSEINDWEVCEPVEFECSGIHDSDTEIKDYRFNPIEVPSQETSYFCRTIEFDTNRDLHLIAMEPIIDNDFVVHHIEMYECVTPQEIDHVRANFMNASTCMGMGACTKMLSAWSLGITGICLVDQAGVRVGMNGAKVAIIKIHYHNPNNREGEIDTSGMRFYQTEKRRQYDAGVFNFGQYYLEIPPGQAYHEEVIECGPFCTKTFTEDIYLIFGAIHMHYLGTSGHVELYRNGVKIQDIMVQDHYDYLSPHIENFEPAVRVQPGDTIRHVCKFQSRDRTDMTWWGGGAFDEMCNIYFAYYPEQNLTNCDNRGTTMDCKYDKTFKETTDRNYAEQGCDIDDYETKYNEYIKPELMSVCDTSRKTCNPGCPEALEWAYSNHSCLSGEAREGMFYRDWQLRNMQSSCRQYPPTVPPYTSTQGSQGGIQCNTSGTGRQAYCFVMGIINFLFYYIVTK